MNTRRDFLKTGTAALLYGSASLQCGKLAAENKKGTKYLDLPLGLELYSVREMLPTDYEGTLKKIAAIGYREVEAAGFYNHSASQVNQAMQEAGLRCVSAHYSYEDLHAKLDSIVAFGKEIGLDYIICPGPGRKDPSHYHGRPDIFTLEDWRWNAEQFNKIGESVHAAGLKFGYHNHTREFKKQDGVTPYDELMRLTDPAKVTMEMDCGWVIVGGGNPIDLLRRYPTRISMLHVKDFKWTKSSDPEVSPPPATELGRGVIDYGPIFEAAARTGQIKHCFVEQEEFDIPAFQSLKIDADYMRKFHA